MNTTIKQKIAQELNNCENTIEDPSSTDAQLGHAIRLQRRCNDALIMLAERCDENDAWCYVQSGESHAFVSEMCKRLASKLDENIQYKPSEITSMLRSSGLISAALVCRRMQCKVSVFHCYEGMRNGVKSYGAGVFNSVSEIKAFLNNY